MTPRHRTSHISTIHNTFIIPHHHRHIITHHHHTSHTSSTSQPKRVSVRQQQRSRIPPTWRCPRGVWSVRGCRIVQPRDVVPELRSLGVFPLQPLLASPRQRDSGAAPEPVLASAARHERMREPWVRNLDTLMLRSVILLCAVLQCDLAQPVAQYLTGSSQTLDGSFLTEVAV